MKAISRGEKAIQRLGFTSRRLHYGRKACHALGLIDENFLITPLGQKYLAEQHGSVGEGLILKQAIETSDIIKKIVPCPFDKKPTTSEVAHRIQKQYLLAESTARDRASTINSWISQISAVLPGAQLQITAVSSAAQEDHSEDLSLEGVIELEPSENQLSTLEKDATGIRDANRVKRIDKNLARRAPPTDSELEAKSLKSRNLKKTLQITSVRGPGRQKAVTSKPLRPEPHPLESSAESRTAGAKAAKQSNIKFPEDSPPELTLPLTYEDAVTIFPREQLTQKMMDFVIPLEEDEETLMRHLLRAKQSGKILFVLGEPGSGKSTFIESLSWRRHIGIKRKIAHIDAARQGDLTQIVQAISTVAEGARREQDLGPTVLVLDYLESLHGHSDDAVRGFFRTLNGILRTAPVLVLWPVVNGDDVAKMISYSEGVSGTMFTRGEEILKFAGPPLDRYVAIAESTIGVANDGRTLSDFGLTRGDLDELLASIRTRTKSEQVIRKYLEAVRERWLERSRYIKRSIEKFPKPTEVWFVICHAEAEALVNTFARRGDAAENAWVANHDALFQYVKGTQRQGFWDAKRLQMAINGVLKTRILFITTNCAVAAIAAYGPENLQKLVLDHGGVRNWLQKARVQSYLESTPLYRQLSGQSPLVGKRKSGPGRQAIDIAEPAFKAINQWLQREGNDSTLNKAIAAAIESCIGYHFESVTVGKSHPWIPGVVPDVRLDPKGTRRHICLEFHFTNNKQPGELAGYCLRKLQVYLQQVEHYLTLSH